MWSTGLIINIARGPDNPLKIRVMNWNDVIAQARARFFPTVFPPPVLRFYDREDDSEVTELNGLEEDSTLDVIKDGEEPPEVSRSFFFIFWRFIIIRTT